MDWFQIEEQKNISGLYSFLFSHIYVLLFFCLKNIAHFHSPETRTSLFSRECKLQKGIFGQFNTLKFIYLRLDPLHPDNQTIKSLSVPPDNSGTKNKPVQTNPQKENRIGNDPEL